MEIISGEAPVDVQRNEDGTLSFSGDVSLSPEGARQLAAMLLDEADLAVERHERRRKTDAVRALLDVIDRTPDAPLPEVDINAGTLRTCYDQEDFDQVFRLLARLGPVEITHSLAASRDDRAYHRARLVLPSGAVLSVQHFDSTPEGIELARQAAEAEAQEPDAPRVTRVWQAESGQWRAQCRCGWNVTGCDEQVEAATELAEHGETCPEQRAEVTV